MTPAYGYAAQTTRQQQVLFHQHMAAVQKDEMIAVLLAFFLGTFGFHRFYLNENGAGVLYLLFSWTGIPTLLGLIECFFMPGRVRTYNAMLSLQIAAWVRGALPAPTPSRG